MAYEVGSQYRAVYEVINSLGAFVTPTTITLTITLPDQTTVVITTPTADSVGDYHFDYTFIQEGLHKFLWVTTGPVTSQSDYQNATFWRSIISIDDAKNFVNYNPSQDREDILRLVLAAATEFAESIAGSCVQRTLTSVSIPGKTRQGILLPHGPLPSTNAVTSVISVQAGGPQWINANGDLIVSPESATITPSNYSPFWLGPWKATYMVGRQVIPVTIQLAVQEIIYDMWATQRPYGADELEPGPEATARFEQMVAQYSYPPHAKALLEGHATPGFG